jgi:hypothetical protein
MRMANFDWEQHNDNIILEISQGQAFFSQEGT